MALRPTQLSAKSLIGFPSGFFCRCGLVDLNGIDCVFLMTRIRYDI